MGFILCVLTIEAQASVVLKSLVVNPSKTKTQKAILKAYLPKEVKPEDIIDLGDMRIDYDIEKSLYYVYQEYELAPGESIGRKIEIKDIWVIPEGEIENLGDRTKELVEKLRESIYFDTAVSLQKEIEDGIGEILNKQEKAMNALPRTHIAAYRENTKQLDRIKNVLAKLEKMVLETKLATGGGIVTTKVSIKATWWLILGVIIALGVLSFVFFIIWHRQAAMEEDKEKAEAEEEDVKPEEPPHTEET